MKTTFDDAGQLTRITKLMDPADAFGEYIGATLIEPSAAAGLADALEATWRRDPNLYYEDGYQEYADRGGEVRAATDRRRSPGSRSTTTTTWHGPGRSHAATSPDRHHAAGTSRCGAAPIAELGAILADRRISAGGDVAVVVGPGQGERIAELIRPVAGSAPTLFTIAGGTLDAAHELGDQLRARSYDAVVGIGGGKTIDTAKYAATRCGMPMVSVATSLANDGIASPVASLDHDGRQAARTACTSRSRSSSTSTSWRTGPTGTTRPASATRSATSARWPTGSWPTRCAASRSTGWPSSLARVGAEALLNHPGDDRPTTGS